MNVGIDELQNRLTGLSCLGRSPDSEVQSTFLVRHDRLDGASYGPFVKHPIKQVAKSLRFMMRQANTIRS